MSAAVATHDSPADVRAVPAGHTHSCRTVELVMFDEAGQGMHDNASPPVLYMFDEHARHAFAEPLLYVPIGQLQPSASDEGPRPIT